MYMSYADTSLASLVCVKTKDVLNVRIVSLHHCEAKDVSTYEAYMYVHVLVMCC
jgi:hypothetical protein